MTSTPTPTIFTARSLAARRWGAVFGVVAGVLLIFLVLAVAFHFAAAVPLAGLAGVLVPAGLGVFWVLVDFVAPALEQGPFLVGEYRAELPGPVPLFLHFSVSFFRPPRIPAA